MRHRAALVTIGAAAALDALAGTAFAATEHLPWTAGMYWAVATATTVGYGDITPKTPTGHLIAVVAMLTTIPLFAAAFSLFTSGLAAGHVARAEERIKAHIEARLKHHLGQADQGRRPILTRTAGKRGRLPALPLGSRLPIKYVHEYLRTPLPVPAYPVDVSGGITDWLMLANGPDPTCTTYPAGVGDCGFAGRQHAEMAKAAAAALPMPTETSDELVAEYLAYDHGQDNGVVLADALLSWYRAGRILAFAPVDHTDPAAVDSAMTAFHGVIAGVCLTDDADELFEQGQPWTTATGQQPDPQDGHVIVKVKAQGNGGLDDWVTWGALQGSTAGWAAACLDEAWVIIMREDDRLDLAALRADIDALGGTGVTEPAAPSVPAPSLGPAGLLAEFGALVRDIAASADRDMSEAVAWLRAHGL